MGNNMKAKKESVYIKTKCYGMGFPAAGDIADICNEFLSNDPGVYFVI